MISSNTPCIVAFTKDWNDVPTCTTHILRIMGRTMPVLWIESIGTRKVSLAGGKDWRRVWRRIRRSLTGAEVKENHLRVLAPLLIPKAQTRVSQLINSGLMRLQIWRELRRMGDGPVEYWCFVPNAVDLLPPDTAARETIDYRLQTLDQESGSRRQKAEVSCVHEDAESGREEEKATAGVGSVVWGLKSKDPRAPRVIYYCIDDWSQFHNLDGKWLQEREEELLRRADVVFAVSRYLVEKCRRTVGDRVVYMPHGVDHSLFARALRPETKEPEDIAGIPHPRIGFYGNLHPWVDFELLEYLARNHQDWHFVLIGEIYCDVSRLCELANVHFLGRREHGALYAYCKGFDVGIIPYDMKQGRMESVNPVKTRELLAAGVPVVAADVPELRGKGADLCVCQTREEWDEGIMRQMKRLDRLSISISVAEEDWGRKVQSIRMIVEGSCE